MIAQVINKVEEYFKDICRIPRPSGKEKAVSDYLVGFAKEHNLTYLQDETCNVILKKEAQGRAVGRNAAPVILQAHLDMVCVPQDYDWAQGVQPEISEDAENGRIMRGRDAVTGQYTSLGADDGIGIAIIMGIFDSTELDHPPLVAVFTADEEAGMGGVRAVRTEDIHKVAGSLDLSQARLINIDEDQDGRFSVGCAGGVRANLRLPILWEPKPENLRMVKISVTGLASGHSGLEIDKKRANAHRLMGRVLDHLQKKGVTLSLLNLYGGEFDNAIPKFSHAEAGVPESQMSLLEEGIREIHALLNKEYNHIHGNAIEPDLNISFEAIPGYTANHSDQVFSESVFHKIISILLLVPNDVLAMDIDVPGLVETSSNLGIIKLEQDTLRFICAVRSSTASRKRFVLDQMKHLMAMTGGEMVEENDYPGWEYREKSELRDTFIHTYEELFSEPKPVARALHAGLECGFFAEKLGDLDMIAFGPTMHDIHTTKETLLLDTVTKAVKLLSAVLMKL